MIINGSDDTERGIYAEWIFKKNLFDKIDQISEDNLHDIIDFIEHILKKQNDVSVYQNHKNREPENDPILGLIGIADSEPFSHVIDDELYGEWEWNCL